MLGPRSFASLLVSDDVNLLGMGSNPVERQRRRFLHHVSKLAGEDQLAISGHLGGLDDHDLAADRGPREADGDADEADAVAQNVFVVGRLKIEANFRGRKLSETDNRIR